MADPRTFTLIGEFKDGITPELEKINKQLATLKSSFAGIGSKKNTGFRGATNDIGKLVSAHKKLSESIKGVEGDLRSTLGTLQQYRREMGKAAAATRAFQKSGGALGSRQFSQNMDAANKSAQAYLKTLQQISTQNRRMPKGGMGGGAQPPRPPRGGGGYGGGGGSVRPPRPAAAGGGQGGGGMGAHMGEFGFAYTLGSGLAQPIQNAIVSGFQIGVGFMTKPFEYFADKLKERIEDEQSDIKAAGGIFSIARRQKDPFVKTMDEAMEFTQTNNKRMAELADALPGNTQQYIEVSKRISDSISRIVMSDPTKAIEYSNKLREEEGEQALEGSKQAQTKGAITQLLGEMTKKTVLAGLGTGGGPGGVAGAYGLPQLTERMLTQDEVSMGQFQRYAAIFKDPLIMEALNRFIPKINASAAGTMERFEVMQKFYDEVLPKEMIRKFERSSAGILELFNTTIFGPETGLFGLGRKMEGMGKVMDDYGNYVKVFEDGTRKAGVSFAEATDANLSLFDLLRDSFANLGIALYPILQNLGSIFDPINKIAKLLVDFRHTSGEFLNAFESYKKGFEDMVKDMDKAKKKEFLKIGLDLRASLAAVNNFFANAGIIDEGQFQANAKQLMSTSFDYKGMMSGMLDTLLNSDVAAKFGELAGEIIGTVLTEVAKVTGFLSGRIASSSKLFAGLKKGFDSAGGTEAFKNIFKDVFMSLFNVLKEALKILPLEAYFMAALAVVAPAAVQGLAMSFASRLWGGMQGFMDVAGQTMMGQLKKQAARFTRVQPVNVTDLGPVITDPRRMLPGTTSGAIVPSGGAAGGAGMGAALARLLPILSKLTVTLTAIVIVGGGVENTLRQLSQFFAEVGSSLAGTFGGLFDLLGVLTGFVGDLGRRIGDLIGSLFGVKGEFDGLKIVLAPLTLALQLLSMGMRGLALAFAELRVFLARMTGDKEYQQRIKERDELAVKLAQDKGRINAYNASMLGKENVKKQMNDAIYLLQNSKNLKADRSAELKAFVEAARKDLGQKTSPANVPASKEEVRTAAQTSELNKKSGQQIKETGAVKASTDKTTQAVNNLATKITPQTNLQTTVASIYNLLASGALRVQTQQQNPNIYVNGQLQSNGGMGGLPFDTRQTDPNKASNIFRWAKGGLGDAVRSEMRMKPPGSDLVIANSSETVIPAAGGNGMSGLMETFRAGWGAIVTVIQQTSQQSQTHLTSQVTALGVTFKMAEEKQRAEIAKITQTLVANQQQTNAKLTALSAKMNTPSMPGGLGGGAAGGVDAFTPIAARMGLQLTSGYRPGDPGWHGANRARDFSNGTGPTPQMMQFAQYMASTYGSNLKELIYTPLGFSIKNGQQVAPYAQGAHYNHVHVAYAGGIGNGVAFNTLPDAEKWERSMVAGSVKVGSVTTNSSEGFGSSSVGDIYVTVNAGSTSDPDQLAYMVAERIQTAVSDAVNANILV
jgi:hypothetical protein